MTQEEKLLLLRDLCARLPYGVKIKVRSNDIRTVRAVDIVEGIVHFVESDSISPFGVHIEHPTTFRQVVNPYLRPMSSMTEEEVKEFNNLVGYEEKDEWIRCNNICGSYGINIIGCSDMIDWLNAHHFDYRGLIEKGLAIEVTEENNPYN